MDEGSRFKYLRQQRALEEAERRSLTPPPCVESEEELDEEEIEARSIINEELRDRVNYDPDK